MTREDAEVVIATVTYSDRAAVCIRIVERALDVGAGRAVVIDNGSAQRASSMLTRWAADRPEVQVVRLPSNEGSAAGFAAALEHAAAAGTRWIWLLDDDNLAAPAALDAALEVGNRAPSNTVVACFRTDDAMQAAVLDGAPVAQTLDVRGSFMGFDLRSRLGAGPEVTGESRAEVEIPWAPYGGLLLPSAAVAEVGLPVREFVLYGDDRDYSRRLRDAGYKIILCRAATVEDVVDRWGRDDVSARSSTGHLAAMINSGDRRRAYYLVRNGVFDDLRRARRDHARVPALMNAAVYLTFVALQSVRRGRPKFLWLVLRAVRAGAAARFYPRDGAEQRHPSHII